MPSYTNEHDLRQIIATTLTSEQLERFIADAHLWVAEVLAVVEPALSVPRLALVERYLSAALVRARDLGLKSSSIADVTEIYQVDPTVSEYLQLAADFDPSGLVRKTFVAPAKATAAAGGVTIFNVIAEVGKGFADDPAPPVRWLQ